MGWARSRKIPSMARFFGLLLRLHQRGGTSGPSELFRSSRGLRQLGNGSLCLESMIHEPPASGSLAGWKEGAEVVAAQADLEHGVVVAAVGRIPTTHSRRRGFPATMNGIMSGATWAAFTGFVRGCAANMPITRSQLSLGTRVGLLAAAAVGAGCSGSQSASDKPKADLSQFDHVGAFVDGLAPVRKGVMWGYADESGRTITKFIYDEAEAFAEGLAAVKTNGKWGFIDKSGAMIIPPRFELVGRFSESLAGVCEQLLLKKCGYIDRTGQFVIKPQYDLANDFHDGIATIVQERADGTDREGLIDKRGRVIMPPQYDDINPFAEGLASVKLNGQWGFIDKAGKLVIPIQFDHAWVFHNGLAPVAKGKWGFIDTAGKFVIFPRFDEIAYNNPEPFDKGVAKVKTYDGWGCITRSGEGVECPTQ